MTASRATVEKKIREYWPHDADKVMAILDRYGDASATDHGRARVQLAVLKLADGSREALQDFVELAIKDYRDVLGSAEYPLEMKARHLARADLSAQQRRELEAIRMQDWEQYVTWLKSAL